MKKIYAIELLKTLRDSGLNSIDLEILFEVSDVWAREILKCEDTQRRCELIKFASLATRFIKQKYSEDKRTPYTLEEIEKLCSIKHLGVVLDLLSSGMIYRVPDDHIIETINSATYAYQAKYASIVRCNPELQKLGIGKLAAQVILKSSAEYKAKYEAIAVSSLPSMTSLEGICYINKSDTEFQAKSILDILCNEKVIERKLALVGAKAISEAVSDTQVVHIKNIVCNSELEVEDIKQRIAAILGADCNWEIVTYFYASVSNQQLPISAVIDILRSHDILNANVAMIERYYKVKTKTTQDV